jgi:C_GCAxxG_C_C family probable redox protein
MSKRKELALEYFKKGYNCAQAVLCAFGPDFEMDRETAFRVSCGFGGGIARLQFTCGAVTGAVMVLGLKFGKPVGDSFEKAKVNTYEPVRRLIDEFKKRNNALACIDLLGLDMNNEEQRKQIKEKNLHAVICEKCVGDCVEILEELVS